MNPLELDLPLPQILLDSIPFGVVVTNAQLELVQVNHWVLSNTKIDPQNASGLGLGEVFPELASRNLLEAYHLVLQGGMPLTLSNRIHRYFFNIPSRNPHQRELPQTATIIPLRSGSSMIGTITFITDVSERINIETSLQREVNKLNALHEIDHAISTLDLAKCLQVIVRRTRAILNAETVALYLFEQAELKIASRDSQVPSDLTPSDLAQWVAANQLTYLSPDLRADNKFNLPLSTIRCEMAAPLIVHDHCIGVLDVQNSEPSLYEQADLDLLDAIANRAATAIHNARLHASERAQRELAESMREISLTLSAELDLEAVLDAILKSTARVVSYDAACILLQENDHLQVKRHLGFDLAESPDSQALLEDYLNHSDLVRLMEKSQLPEVQHGSIRNVSGLAHNLEQRLNTWAGAPIIMRGQRLGFLLLGKKAIQAYDQPAAQQLAVFASSAGIALQNARSYSQQRNLAITDGLTGLSNRRRFDDELNREMERVSRYNRPTSLIMMDIDDFKHYNDTHGHPAGDALLQILADLLRQNTREIEIVTRYGGEEFAIIIPEVDLEAAGMVAERIRISVAGMHLAEGPQHLPGIKSPVTLSLGVACAPKQASTPAELIHAADSALYAAKRRGKNQIVLYENSTASDHPGIDKSR